MCLLAHEQMRGDSLQRAELNIPFRFADRSNIHICSRSRRIARPRPPSPYMRLQRGGHAEGTRGRACHHGRAAGEVNHFHIYQDSSSVRRLTSFESSSPFAEISTAHHK